MSRNLNVHEERYDGVRSTNSRTRSRYRGSFLDTNFVTLRGDEGSNSVLATIKRQARTAAEAEKSAEEKVKNSKFSSGGHSFGDASCREFTMAFIKSTVREKLSGNVESLLILKEILDCLSHVEPVQLNADIRMEGTEKRSYNSAMEIHRQ